MLKKISLILLNFYQAYVRVCLPCFCRFSPSCSEYAKEAMQKYGFWQGAGRALRRLLKCHPFSGRSGWDPLT